MARTNRRQFLEDSMLAAAAAVAGAGPSELLGAEAPSRSALEKLGVAVIGVRGRGNSHLRFFTGRRDTEVLYICDVDRQVGMARAQFVSAHQEGREPQFVEDFRQALDDPRVDIVTVATPNHWHALCAIWAMQAGKDVYVEKPVSHNVAEGRRMVEVARAHQRICQAGLQARSNPGVQQAIRFVQEGTIGSVALAHAVCYKRRAAIGPPGEYSVPSHINYDLWLGPAPLAPLSRPRFHHDWQWQWSYGNGTLGNQGAHQLDLCRWGLEQNTLSRSVVSCGGRLGCRDAGQTANTQVVLHDFGTKRILWEARELRSQPLRGVRVGVIFEGTDGFVVMSSLRGGAAFDGDGRQIAKFQGEGGGAPHFRNFLAAVRSRNCRALNADIEVGHVSSALGHTANISYRLGTSVSLAAAEDAAAVRECPELNDALDRTVRHLKAHGVDGNTTSIRMGRPLTCDPYREIFPSDGEASSLLTRVYRRPFVVRSKSPREVVG